MGNNNPKQSASNSQPAIDELTYNDRRIHQISTNVFSSRSDRFFASVSSQRSPVNNRSRESTRRCDCGKTVRPILQRQACFLPEFPVANVQFNDENYERLTRISHGTYGEVYRVRDRRTDKVYALKRLSKNKIVGTSFIRQVKNEVQFQKLCGHHEFIVNYVQHWQSQKRLYLVSDFIDGGELLTLLRSYGALPVVLTQLYLAEIAVAIDFLHNAGIIHRDVKPENVLLDDRGHVKLIDFGFAKWLSYGSKTSTLCGSMNYMAPEVASNQPYGHAADWWSLGVIACAMLTNKLPTPAVFINEDNQPKLRDNPGNLPENVTLDVTKRDLLLRLLENDPTKRLRSIRTLQTIGFYKGYNIPEVIKKKISPKELLLEHYPNGPPAKEDDEANDLIEDFSCTVDTNSM